MSDQDGRVDDLRVAVVVTPQSMPDQLGGSFFSSVAGERCGNTGSDPEAGAPCGGSAASASGGGNGESWRYSNTDLWILTGIQCQWIIQPSLHEFQNWVCGMWCLDVCTNNIHNIDIVTLGTCVANMGLVLYIGGDFILRLRIVLLVGMLWADVMCDMG